MCDQHLNNFSFSVSILVKFWSFIFFYYNPSLVMTKKYTQYFLVQ